MDLNKTIILLLGVILLSGMNGLNAQEKSEKPRVIATTDGEIDDHSSMIRFLLYASDYEVAGIVEVNSRFQKNGHSKEPWLEKQLDAYEQVLPNLRKHKPDYPSADYLRGICRVGNENINDLWVAPPDMTTKDTPGEKLIINTLLDNDPRPVHVLSWGGANTTASALWKLKTAYPKEKFDYAVSRIRIYCIWYQDGGGKWIQENIPEAHINEAYRWDNVWDYESYDGARGEKSANPPEIQELMKPAWVDANVKLGHGPLGALTPQKYISEGDTPSFLHLINNGLAAHLDYTLGGWGGRSAFDDPAFPNHITDKTLTDDGNPNKMYWRWVPSAQNDFAARMDWCVKEFKDANHAPVAKVKGALVRDVKPGETVKLAATATDPDGNQLACKWWQYTDADCVGATVAIANSASLDNASFVAPNEPGKQVHIILEVTDNGTPPLTGYQRVICNIKSTSDVSTGVNSTMPSINRASAPVNQTEPGAPYSPHPEKVVVTKVKHFDNMCWKIATAGGTWYFENGETDGKSGFSSAFDLVGNDWIGNDADKGYNKSPSKGGRREYRGWPNFGEGNFDHPQRKSGTSTRWVDAGGKEIPFVDKLEGDHLIMRSANANYELEYHFFPTHAAIKVLKANDKYAFLFEGPIGGEQEASVEKDYYVLKDGKPLECKAGGLGYLEPGFGNKFPSPFFYLVDSDPKDTQVLYVGVKNTGPETAGDEGWRQGENMVIFSYGRDQDKRAYTGTNAVCVFGFYPKAAGHEAISSFIEARLANPFNAPKIADGKANRLRVIVTSDFPPFPVTNSDPDDVQTMVRFLLYANEFDIEGLIASAGTYDMVAEKKNILAVLDKYDQVDENLRKHDPKYPTAAALRAVTFEGKGNNNGIKIKWGCDKQPYIDIIGEGKDSDGSDAIIAAADKPDPRPIYIGVWGGPREVAQAIWKVKNTRSEVELKAFISKLRVFLIFCQDATHQWLMDEFPDLFIIESRKTYQGMFRSDSREWAEENIINNHGPLGAIYPPKAAGGPGVIEGDSPTFLYLVSANRGINEPEDPTQPSWGGQYVRKGSTKHYVDGPGGSTISKWKSDFQAEFKQRADWMLP